MFKRRKDFGDLREMVDRHHVEALQCRIPGDAAAHYNRAGDLLLAAGDFVDAIQSYGRAVDSLIEADRVEASIALCRKIIRVVPQVVRARCTLTWLVIGAGYTGDARSCASEYVTYAEFSGRQEDAVEHLREMSEVALEHEVREVLGECLMHLGEYETADRILGSVYQEREAGVRRALDAAVVWDRIRTAALLGPELRPRVR